MPIKCRGYCFTLNNYTDLEYTAILEIECRYLVVGKETGEEGTPHLQGFIYFENARSFDSVKKDLGKRVHIEAMKGTPQQAADYCKKDKDFIDKGDLPAQGKRSDIDNIKEQISVGKGMRDIVEIATSYQSIKCAEALMKYKEKKRNWAPEVIYIHGKSGTGKTRWVYDNFPFDDIHKTTASIQLKWFEGYDQHPVSLLDEIDYDVCYSRLKDLTDRYPCTVETKGGSRQYLAKVIVLTSLIDPYTLFDSYPEKGKEMLRRITKIISL